MREGSFAVRAGTHQEGSGSILAILAQPILALAFLSAQVASSSYRLSHPWTCNGKRHKVGCDEARPEEIMSRIAKKKLQAHVAPSLDRLHAVAAQASSDASEAKQGPGIS